MPWADQLEFRTETDEMELSRQEYLTRFRFNNKAIRKAYENIHLSNIQSEEIENILILEQSLMNKYFLLIKYNTLLQELTLKKEQQKVALDIIYVLKKKAENSSEDFSN